MNKEQMTKEQVIRVSIGVLSEISVPVKYKDTITAHIDGVINNLVLVLNMMDQEKQKAQADGEGQEGVEYGTETDPE